MVDTYCKIEGEGLLSLCQNQNRLRAAEYIGLKRDYFGDEGAVVDEGQDWRVGRLFVIPIIFSEDDGYIRQ